MNIFARGHGNHKLAPLSSNLLVFATPLMLFQCFLAPGRGAEEPGGGLEEAWMALGEGLSTSLGGPRSHLGSAQGAGGAEEWFLLPLSRFWGLPGYCLRFAHPAEADLGLGDSVLACLIA